MVEYRRGGHAVTDLKYHVIWVTKYRYKILSGGIAEGAGAASTAAAIKLKDRLQGQQVACVLSGGNLPLSTLQRILAETRPELVDTVVGH